MKICPIGYVFSMVVVCAVAVIPGYAQQSGRVGVNLVLKPIQAIAVNMDRDNRAIEAVVVRAGEPRGKPIVSFGTSQYALSVDSIHMDMRHRIDPALLAHALRRAYLNPGDAKQREDPAQPNPFRTLVVYSIQVN